MSEENLNKKFEEEFNKLSEKDKREVNNLIRFMQEKKYHDSQYEELLSQYIELSRDYDKLENIIKEVREYIEEHLEREYFDYDILEANTIYNRDLYKVLKILDKLQELKGNNNGVWVNNLLEVIKENNIEFGSDKE